MIKTNIQDVTATFLLKKDPVFQDIFNFLRTSKINNIQVGKHNITDQIKANVQEYTTKAENNGRWESHKKFVDLQFILSGKEHIRVARNTELEVIDNQLEQKDALYYQNKSLDVSTELLCPNDMIMLFPEDAHMACLTILKPELVKKIVVKIPTEFF